MKTTTTAYVHMTYAFDYASGIYEKAWHPKVRSYKYEDEENVFINQQEITVEIPDDFDPVPSQVAALEKQKLEALANYQQAVAEINDRLSKIQALEFAP